MGYIAAILGSAFRFALSGFRLMMGLRGFFCRLGFGRGMTQQALMARFGMWLFRNEAYIVLAALCDAGICIQEAVVELPLPGSKAFIIGSAAMRTVRTWRVAISELDRRHPFTMTCLIGQCFYYMLSLPFCYSNNYERENKKNCYTNNTFGRIDCQLHLVSGTV